MISTKLFALAIFFSIIQSDICYKYLSIVYRTPSTIPLLSGGTRKFTTLEEGRLVLTNMKLNYPRIGRRTSQRFVLECGTAQ